MMMLAASLVAVPAQAEKGTGKTFDVALFGKNIQGGMDAVAGGFAWSVAQNGKPAGTGKKGFARTPADGNLPHSPSQRQNIASVSKMITAVAVLQTLRMMGKDEDTLIAGYFPPGWKKGPNVDTLTFAHLLGHRSGFPNANMNSKALLDYSAMKAMVAAGTPGPAPLPAPPKGIDYRNVNYALLRVLLYNMHNRIPGVTLRSDEIARTMEGQLGEITGEAGSDEYVGKLVSWFYAAWVQKNVLEPVGVKGALCQDKSATQTLYYDRDQTIPGNKSMGNNSWSEFCGSGGWYLSSNDLVRFMTFLHNSEVLLPAAWRQRMIDKRFGVMGRVGDFGTYWNHGGVVGSGGGGGIHACIMRFPNNVEAAVVANVVLPPKISTCPILADAYDAAWK
ncbi:serine hydrolase domain-containing protein [Sandaracinobacteroides saxicola]|uniref:Serine hydrolase n=1 Tax=Sandaracinobacteroides saxicola TaxID=2759707 RepID=A0A7G5IKB3_9SPHN|nr:serine hydrolase [Sandaracinobacteroides saxicola]QMW23805.1 serine hydrolase [Sandaracinobacteroides saxicola]